MKLPLETKSICARIALEQNRQVITRTTQALRTQAGAMLGAGQSEMMVQAHLQAMLVDALRSQA
jgi:hypothetical protein